MCLHHLHYHHNERLWKAKLQKNVDTSLFPLCTIINHPGAFFFFFFSIPTPTWLKKKNKIKKSHAYLISFSTGSNKGNCHRSGHLSQKSLLNQSQVGEEEKKIHEWKTISIIARLQMKCCLSSRVKGRVVFLLSDGVNSNQDRSRRTLSAAMTNCGSARVLFSTHGSSLSENKAGFMAAEKRR